MKGLNYFHNCFAALGVQHGGGFVEDYDFGVHGEYAGYGDALLLAARKKMWGVLGVIFHADGFQGIIHKRAYFGRGDAEIFGGEGDIFLNDAAYYLVIGILEDHADCRANLKEVCLI